MTTDYEILESVPDAVVVTAQAGEIVFANRRAELLSGYTRSELIGRHVEVLVPAKLRGEHTRQRRDFYRHGTARLMGEADSDFSLRRKNGTNVTVEISLGPAGHHTMAVIRDVTERHDMEKALEHRALHDPLTDLANRSLFFDRLRQAIHSARRDGSMFAAVLLDVDGFKSVNDSYGHSTGDAVLRELAVRLGHGLRATDTAARIGGDEFALIVPRVSGRPVAGRIIRKRLAEVQRPVRVDDFDLEIGVSAGIALYPEDGRDTDALIRNADAAMYAAKREGVSLAFHMPRRAAASNKNARKRPRGR